MSTVSSFTNLKMVLPEDRLIDADESVHPLGNGGNIVVCPQTEEEIANILGHASHLNQTVSVMGAGTKRGYGGQLKSADILLSLQNYKGIVEHTPGDMTVTVKAGTPFGELQDYLSQYHQRVPIDPFLPEESTIGGIIASNDSGPKRLGWGSARDSVIGMRIVYPDGKVIRAGGKVVKNVAGYDMNKLFIGSMGTLGVLSEVTFKLRPLPKYESVALIFFPEGSWEEIRRLAAEVLDSMIEPVSLELLSPALSEKLAGKRQLSLVAGFEDVESSVIYQENVLKSMVPADANIQILTEHAAREFWSTFYSRPNDTSSAELESAVKIGVVNMDVLQMMEEAVKLDKPEELCVEMHGGLGHGLCRATLRGKDTEVLLALSELRDRAERLGGYAVITHLPFEYREQIDVWGQKPSYFFLLEGIKRAIDPEAILNRQRFLGGI